jgi:cell division transport system permease protein
MLAFFNISSADRRLLPEGRSAGPMPWVIGIMTLLTVLAAATGLLISGAASHLSIDIEGKLSVQLPEANASQKNGQIRALSQELAKLSAVQSVTRIEDEKLKALLDPWLGDVTGADDLPLPALIDIDMRRIDDASITEVEAIVKGIAPSAHVTSHASWLAPLAGLMSSLKWLSIGLVVLMLLATGSVVVLAVKAALDTHKETIGVMHVLGANDGQIAGLFQRRIALDALLGCAAGFSVALAVLAVVGNRIGQIGSDLLGGTSLGWSGWLLIVAIPVLGTLLAAFVARYTVTLSLSNTL